MVYENRELDVESITIKNQGAGADPVLSSSSVSQLLRILGVLLVTSDITAWGNLSFTSGTAFSLMLDHNITANRVITLPDGTTTLVGIDQVQTLTNKTITSLAITNIGTGANPGLASNSAGKEISITDSILCGLLVQAGSYLRFKSNTSFYHEFRGTPTAARIVTVPDKDITIADDADIKVAQVIPLDDMEASIDTPVATNFSGEHQLESYWLFDTGEQIRTKLTYSPPEGFNKLKIQALVQAGSNTIEWGFNYSRDGGGITACGADIPGHTNRYVLQSNEIAVTDIQVIRLFLGTAYANGDSKCYGFKLIWYK